nr:hypothetical protein [Tanacetum cinerariifolium]
MKAGFLDSGGRGGKKKKINNNDTLNEVGPVGDTSTVMEGVTPSMIDMTKWHPDENLLKEDVSTVPVWVKLHGVPVTAFGDDDLSVIATKPSTPLMLNSYTSDVCMQSWGRSSYARVMIELRADVDLKETLSWLCLKLLGKAILHVMSVLSAGEKKTMKKPCQTSRGVPVGSKISFKHQKEYRPVLKKLTATSSVNKKKCVEPTIEVINSNPFDVLNSVVNDVEFDTNGGNTNLVHNGATLSGSSFMNVDNSSSEFPGEYDSEDEVASVDNDMARSMASKRVGFSTQSLLEQWRDSYGNGDYDDDPYDVDMYESQILSHELQAICDNLDIPQRLFLECPIAADLWKGIRLRWGLSDYPQDLLDLVSWADNVPFNSQARSCFDVVVHTVTWVLWRYLNRLCFELKPPRKDTLFEETKVLSQSWITHIGARILTSIGLIGFLITSWDKPYSFFAPEGKPSRRGLNPRPLACGNNLLKFILTKLYVDLMGRARVMYQDESRNSPFNYEKAWAILRQHAKWDAPEVAQVELTEDETGDFHATVNTDELFGADPRPRPPGKQCPRKKTKSDTSASTGGSQSSQFGEFVSHELRLKREAAEKAFEASKNKDETIKSLEELRFLVLSTKDLSDDDAYCIERKNAQIKAKLRAEMPMELNNEDDSDE